MKNRITIETQRMLLMDYFLSGDRLLQLTYKRSSERRMKLMREMVRLDELIKNHYSK